MHNVCLLSFNLPYVQESMILTNAIYKHALTLKTSPGWAAEHD